MTSFNGLIRFNFSEIGIGINIQGQGFLSFIANTTIFTLLSTGSDGNPIMALQNVTYNVTSSSFRNLTQLNAPVAATVQTNLLAYLNTKSYTFFMQAFQNRITTYINSANNYRLISGTKVYIDLRWVGGPTINYNASLGCSQNSITS